MNNIPNEERRKRLIAIVHGRVQGVGFRYYVIENARHLQLSGVCRNLRNGDVEVIAEGEEGALEALVVALKQGPRASHVEEVTIVWLPPTNEFHTFMIGSTR